MYGVNSNWKTQANTGLLGNLFTATARVYKKSFIAEQMVRARTRQRQDHFCHWGRSAEINFAFLRSITGTVFHEENPALLKLILNCAPVILMMQKEKKRGVRRKTHTQAESDLLS